MSVSFRVSNRGLGNQAMHIPTSNLSAYILAYKYCRKRRDVGLDFVMTQPATCVNELKVCCLYHTTQ